MSATTHFKQELMAALDAGVDRVLRGEVDVARLGRPADVATRMLAAAGRHVYDEQVGPFYDTAGVELLLGTSRQALHDRVGRLTILAAKTSSGRVLYPTFQFLGRQVNPRVRTVLSAFRGVPVDGWAIATWFTTEASALGGRTPAAMLAAGDGREGERVVELARDTAARWAAP